MTEKDAVKCEKFALDKLWSVPVEPRLPTAFYTRLLDKLESIGKG